MKDRRNENGKDEKEYQILPMPLRQVLDENKPKQARQTV